MKHMLFVLSSSIILLSACKKETTSTAPLNEVPDITMAMAKDSGQFMNGPYGTVTGIAKIYKTGDKYELALEKFSTSNGPDLKVYLSKETQPVNFVNLGSLKSTNGNQLYTIPVSVAVTDYKYALIHCQQYNHLFGYAQLRP